MTISEYFGQASCGSNSSSALITPQQLLDIIGNLKEEWRKEVEEEYNLRFKKMKQELKKAIKIELTQMPS